MSPLLGGPIHSLGRGSSIYIGLSNMGRTLGLSWGPWACWNPRPPRPQLLSLMRGIFCGGWALRNETSSDRRFSGMLRDGTDDAGLFPDDTGVFADDGGVFPPVFTNSVRRRRTRSPERWASALPSMERRITEASSRLRASSTDWSRDRNSSRALMIFDLLSTLYIFCSSETKLSSSRDSLLVTGGVLPASLDGCTTHHFIHFHHRHTALYNKIKILL